MEGVLVVGCRANSTWSQQEARPCFNSKIVIQIPGFNWKFKYHGNLFFSLTTMNCMACANNRVHYVPKAICACLQITPSHYHHYTQLLELNINNPCQAYLVESIIITHQKCIIIMYACIVIIMMYESIIIIIIRVCLFSPLSVMQYMDGAGVIFWWLWEYCT